MCITKRYIISLDSQTDLIREVDVTGRTDNVDSSTNILCFTISVDPKQTTCVSNYRITINDGTELIKVGNWKFLHHSITCVNSKGKKLRIDIKGLNIIDKQEYDFFCTGNYIENIEDLPYYMMRLIAVVGRCKTIKEFDAANSNNCNVFRIKAFININPV